MIDTEQQAGFDSLQFVIGGALGLAAHFFPRALGDGKTAVSLDDACFLLSGQVGVWSRWPELEVPDQARLARLLRFRPVEVANRNVFHSLVDDLVPDRIAGFLLWDEGHLLVDLGRPPLDFVDECIAALWSEQELQQRRSLTTARSGDYGTTLFAKAAGRPGDRAIDARYRLILSADPQREEPIDIDAPVAVDVIDVSVPELRDIAAQLDRAFGQRHRLESLDRVFSHLHASDGNDVGEAWILRAGPTRILQAPTGIGKNVLAEMLACWCAQRGLVTSLVVPDNAVVVKTAYELERCLQALGTEGDVVALTSPHSAQRVAETAAGRDEPDGLGMWAVERLAYGCALPSAATTDDAVDVWQPGSEPCSSLRRLDGDGRPSGGRYACPWRPSCGKYRNVRAAATSASIVVTSHHNWLAGVVHVPVRAQGRVENSMSVEELLLHRSHVVLVDEIDAFQQTMIGRSAKGLVLAHRRRRSTPPPLRRLDTEFADAPGRVNAAVEHDVRAATAHARYLAESYTGHLAEGEFRRQRQGRKRPHPLQGRWLLPRKWDAWLAATLFGLADDEQPSPAHYKALQDLFGSESDPALESIPEWLVPVAIALTEVTTITAGADSFQQAWDLIYTTLGETPYEDSRLADEQVRVEATDRLIRRAYLDRLRRLLFQFVYAAPQLQASGVSAAQEIAEALGQYAVWRAAPYGPLGRALFAFTEHYDAERPQDTALRVSAFGGDPHTYVTTLGDLTALAHLGLRRAVIGLSATAFLPGAPHHHVFRQPTWWVPDDRAGDVKVTASAVADEDDFIRISGTYGPERTNSLVKLGELLWKKHLTPALRDLAADPSTAHRQRLLLATTSYQGAMDLAEGISNANVPADRIVLAVRPDEPAGRRGTRRWTELPADQLEAFGRDVDGTVLIAPLARAQRGLNIVDSDGRSLLGSVWLIVRPLPLVDEPAEILAHVHASAHSVVRPTDQPAATLDLLRQFAGRRYEEFFAALPYFRTLPEDVQLSITAEIVNGLIQLAGRARRGGDISQIHLVDYAFLDTRGHADFPRLIRRLRQQWEKDGHLELVKRLYGHTIQVIFDFAESRNTDGDT